MKLEPAFKLERLHGLMDPALLDLGLTLELQEMPLSMSSKAAAGDEMALADGGCMQGWT